MDRALPRCNANSPKQGVDYVFRSEAELSHLRRGTAAAGASWASPPRSSTAPTYLRDEPALRDGVVGVVRFPGDARLRPDRYVAELARAVREAGGVIEEHCEVHGIAHDRRWRARRAPRRASGVPASGDRHRRVVAAAGEVARA